MKRLLLFLSLIIVSISMFSQKNVLIEEVTGTWCQYCPRGFYYSDSLTTEYDNVIAVSVHLNDVMKDDEYAAAVPNISAPSANFNRNYMSIVPESWFGTYTQEMQIQPKVDMEIAAEYDESTKLITATVELTALENISGDYRIVGIITEDGVTGPAPAYNQSNIYSNGQYGYVGGYENLPNPIPAQRIAYDHVGRKLLGGYNGFENSFPTSLLAGQSHSYSIEYTLPDDYDYNYVRVIAALIKQSDGKIDNACKSLYLNGNNNAAPLFTSTEKTESYVNLNYIYNIYVHDPDNKDLTITASTLPSWLTFEQIDNKSAIIYGVPTAVGDNGVVIEVTDGALSTTQAFFISVGEPLEGEWKLLGDRGITEESCYVLDACADEAGNLYALIRENSLLTVYCNYFDEQGWVEIGASTTTITIAGGIAINSEGEIFVTFVGNNDQIKVQKLVQSEWVNVGTQSFTGATPDIAIAGDDVIYIVFMDFSSDYHGAVYRYENEAWTAVGTNGQYSTAVTTWYQIETYDNKPYVLYTDFENSNYVSVSRFDGNTWNVVGYNPVSTTYGSYYYQEFAFDSEGNIYVAFCTFSDFHLATYKYNGTEWISLGENVTENAVSFLDLDLNEDELPVISYCDNTLSNYISTIEYKDGEWIHIGQEGFSVGASSYLEQVIIDNTPFVIFMDVEIDNRASCMYYETVAALYPPTNFAATLFNDNCVNLSWNLPVQGTPVSYNIYRNDALLQNVSEMEYNDNSVPIGVYRYTITAVYEAGESTPEGPITIEIILGTDEMDSQDIFKIYPTMVSDAVTIETTVSGKLEILSVNGEIIKSQNYKSGTSSLNISSLKSGMYIIRFNYDKGVFINKIIKK